MNRWKKGVALSVAVVLATSLAACSKDSKTNSTTDNGGAAKDVTLTVEVFDRGNVPPGGEPVTNNYWTRWIQEKFGDPNHIKVQFVSVPRSEEVNKLNVLMAANEAPDLVFTYDRNVVINYAASGGLAKLDDPLNQYAPDLKKFIGPDALQYGVLNGGQYAIPGKRTVLGVRSDYIRQDWLDKVGMKAPTTRDELYKVLKAFKEQDPGKVGSKLVPLTINIDSMVKNGHYALQTFGPMSEEESYTLPDIKKPGYKEGVQFFNKLYNEGLMSPNFAIDKDGTFANQEITNGYSGTWEDIPNFLMPGGGMSKLKTNVPAAQVSVIDPWENSQGKHPKWLYDPIGAYLMVPKASQHVKEAMMYLNWMSKPDVLYSLQNGIEGTHYKKNDEGYPIPTITDENKKTFYNNGDIAMIANGKDFGSKEKNIKGMALSAVPEYQKLAEQAINQSYVDGYFKPFFTQPIKSEAKDSQALQQKLSEILVKSITAKPADFDKVFDAGLQDYMSSGGKEVMDEKKAAYQAMKKGK